VSVDEVLGQVVIDFDTKKGHSMQREYALESLILIANDHILARRVLDQETLRQMAADDPVELVRLTLLSFEGNATPDQIQAALCPSIISAKDFKKWWEGAKRGLKKDGHFFVPPKKGVAIVLRETAVSRNDELIERFRNARQTAEQIAAVDEILKNPGAFPDPETLKPIVGLLTESAQKLMKMQPAQAVELALAADAIVTAHPSLESVAASDLTGMVRDLASKLSDILPKLPSTRQRRLLTLVPGALGEDWVISVLRLLRIPSSRTVQEIVRLLADNGQQEALLKLLDRDIRDHGATSDALLVVCRDRDKLFKPLSNPRLLRAILAAIERDQASETRRGGRLHDLLVEDQELITDLLEGSSKEEVRDALRSLILSSVFDELSKRSLMARIIKIQPELEALLAGGEGEQDTSVVVSWQSLERRKLEYEDLVNKKIPENTKDISIARSYGDLRENFEFKSAKEQQAVLMRRKAELEVALTRARGTDFSSPDTSMVSIGTIVRLRDEARGSEVTYTILGAWDSDPDKHVISYQTAIGQALLSHKPGEVVEIPTDIGSQRFEILEVKAWK